MPASHCGIKESQMEPVERSEKHWRTTVTECFIKNGVAFERHFDSLQSHTGHFRQPETGKIRCGQCQADVFHAFSTANQIILACETCGHRESV